MRQPEPFYRSQNKSWYVQVGKKQHYLCRDEKPGKAPPPAAVEQYRAIMAGRQDVADDTAGLQVIEILRRFLEWTKANKAGSTHAFYKRHVLSFAAHAGDRLTVQKLKPFHVTQWMDKCYPKRKTPGSKGAGDNYRRSAIRSVQRALSWAKKEGYIEVNLLAGYEKPAYTPRDAILTPEQWGQLVSALENRGATGRAFLDFLMLMRHTGCRPLEARTAEARHLDVKKRCLVFERIESKGHGGKTTTERRVVPLTDAAFEMCHRLAKQNPEGPLLRNSQGNPWKPYAIKEWFKRLDANQYKHSSGKRIPFRTSAYVIRHTWATEALERGVDAVTVASIMGHKDVTMLMKVYQHIEKKGDYLRESLHRAVGLVSKLPVAVPA